MSGEDASEMNGLTVKPYTYNGTLTGDNDPWSAPEPVKQKRQPKQPRPPRTPRQPPTCGTYAKYTEHYRRGEKCAPCLAAKAAYDRERRKNNTTAQSFDFGSIT